MEQLANQIGALSWDDTVELAIQLFDNHQVTLFKGGSPIVHPNGGGTCPQTPCETGYKCVNSRCILDGG